MSRGVVVGRAAGRLGIVGLRGLILGAAGDGGARPAARAEAAPVLARALGQLRGTAVKMAQVLSLETTLLPDELVEALRAQTAAAQPMGGPIVRHVVESDLGARVADRFRAFDDRPFAAASLGQVHAGTTTSGLEVAVKVRYPGIERAIEADLRLMRRIMRPLPDSRFLLSALHEIEARLHEEVDYLHEAAQTRWFRDHLDVPGVVVPAVDDRRSGRCVLTTRRLPGVYLDEWLAPGPPDEVIDQTGQRLVDVFVRSLHGLGRIHADTNLGNFLFSADGTVGVVDFGCVKEVGPATVKARRAVLRALLAGDEPGTIEAYRELGAFPGATCREAAGLRESYLAPMEAWLTEPLRHDVFDFREHQGYGDLGRAAFQRMAADRTGVRLPREQILIERTWYGICRHLERMGARVRVRGLVD